MSRNLPAIRAWLRVLPLAPRFIVLVSCFLVVLSASAGCPAVQEPVTSPRYSLADFRQGRVPERFAVSRATVALGEETLEVAVVTDADRARLADDWPPFPRDVRLMLVTLDAGQVLWTLRTAAIAESQQRFASDPALSVPLGRAAVLTGAGGVALRVYAGDAAGRVWRVDLPPLEDAAAAASLWQVDLLASLAPQDAPGDVRFRLPPDLVRSVDALGQPFDGLVLVAEGAPPDAATGAGNGLYFLHDYAVSPRRASDPALPVIVASDLTPDADADPPGDGPGWFSPFANPVEVAQAGPRTDGGRIFLVTAAPAPICDEPPLTLTYIFNLADGRPLQATVPGSIAGMGWLGGPRLEGSEIVLPGRGIALQAEGAETEWPRRTRFRAAGVGAVIRYWRDLLLDVD